MSDLYKTFRDEMDVVNPTGVWEDLMELEDLQTKILRKLTTFKENEMEALIAVLEDDNWHRVNKFVRKNKEERFPEKKNYNSLGKYMDPCSPATYWGYAYPAPSLSEDSLPENTEKLGTDNHIYVLRTAIITYCDHRTLEAKVWYRNCSTECTILSPLIKSVKLKENA